MWTYMVTAMNWPLYAVDIVAEQGMDVMAKIFIFSLDISGEKNRTYGT